MKDISLTIKERDWEKMIHWLLQADQKERQCFLELGICERREGIELLLHRINTVPDEDYSVQNEFRVKPKEKAVFDAYKSFASSGVLVHGHIHSHPFSDAAHFSALDINQSRSAAVRGISDLVKLQALSEATCFFQWVMGKDPAASEGYLFDLKGGNMGALSSVRVVGLNGFSWYGKNARSPHTASSNDERLERNIRWLGEGGQCRLSRTHVAICGLGGVGALLAANIRGLGFGEVTLIDPDRVEWSNLNRLVGAGAEDVDAFKVDVYRREIRRVNPQTKVNTLPVGVEDLKAQKILREADVILSAVDGMGPRLELQVLAARFLKPLFDVGSGIAVASDGSIKKIGSQIIVYIPGGPCLACQGMDIFRPTSGLAGRLRRFTGYVSGTDFTPTSVVTVNSVVAGWAVDLLIKYLTGLKEIPLYTQIDQWDGAVQILPFKKKIDCSICGSNGIEGKGDDPAQAATGNSDTDDGFRIEPATAGSL